MNRVVDPHCGIEWATTERAGVSLQLRRPQVGVVCEDDAILTGLDLQLAVFSHRRIDAAAKPLNQGAIAG